ncbi:cation:proton antiporter [Endomicrobium proavitum]|uniref:Putative potassium efflux system protein n=1 Tax=Endomicrobium proavitum TaxID=1408281 RepID=A0A0G3WI95_9BACT|nr:cation:proton antiporter [Endomicrobium proavitum]AKL97605.1 putative potassium efflux system protein [Endomicrobium proavitum]
MHEYQLLYILGVGFAFALAFGFITQKLGLSSIVGYLLAGFLIGPNTPFFTADYSLAFQLSEAGVILLMFGVGLHFKIDDLLAVKGVAIPGAIVQSAVATVIGTYIGTLLGLDLQSGLILGLGLAVASTVVLLRVLSDNDALNTVHGHVAVGWLVVEDILTVLILVVLPILAGMLNSANSAAAGGGESNLKIVEAVAFAVLKIGVLWILVIEAGGRLVPWIMSKVARTRSQELFTLTVLVIAFATAMIAAVVFQASFALGAFLGGMVVGKSKVSNQAAADILPLRDAFAVLFFLSVGMLFDPRYFIEYPLLILACLAIVLIVKPLTAMFVVTILGYSIRTALTVAAGLAQVGEFSFILAQEAKRLNLAGDTVYNAIVICAIISITLNPAVFSRIPAFETILRSKEKLWNFLNAVAEKRGSKRNKNQELAKNLLPTEDYLAKKTALIIGYGPTGQKITQMLLEHDVHPIIIEMNVDTVNSLSAKGFFTIYGDSTKKDILEAAGISSADYVIITVPSLSITSATASLAAALNPKARIFVRARFLHSKEHLKQIGISGIAIEEEEVAKSLTSLLLDDLEEQSLLAAAAEIAAEECKPDDAICRDEIFKKTKNK